MRGHGHGERVRARAQQRSALRVLGQACDGLAIVVCGERDVYDRAHWAPYAEGKVLGKGCCSVT